MLLRGEGTAAGAPAVVMIDSDGGVGLLLNVETICSFEDAVVLCGNSVV